jgi:hypothetical protein
MTSRDLFGSPEQQALLARGAALHRVTANDPTKTYYGRTTSIFSPTLPYCKAIRTLRRSRTIEFPA